MSRRAAISIIAAAGLVAGSPGLARETDGNARTDAILTEIVRGSGDPARAIAGLAAIRIKDGVIAYEYYSGEHAEAAEAGVRDNDAETLYRIASISKMVVAVGLMTLVEAGEIDLDADVSDRLGFTLRNPHFPDTPITARMLMSHTSTILDADLYSLPPDRAVAEFFDPSSPLWADGGHFIDPEKAEGVRPGAYFTYANLNYGLLGTLIERASGKRFDVFMQDAVLGPLGLDASYNVRTLSDVALSNLAPLYRPVEGIWTAQVDDLRGVRPDDFVEVENPDAEVDAPPARLPLVDYEIGTNGTVFSPQGGLRISARGLAEIVILLMERGTSGEVTLLRPASVDAMEGPTWTYDGEESGDPYYGLFQAYGLGVHTLLGERAPGGSDIPFDSYAGGLRGHPGEAYGLLSGAYYDPDTGDGYVRALAVSSRYVYLIGGTPNLDDNLGSYSSFFSWEEGILTALGKI